MGEVQIQQLWNSLEPKDITVLALQFSHLIMFDSLACSYASFACQPKPIYIDWSECKSRLSSAELAERTKSIFELFGEALGITQNPLRQDDIPLAVNYISMLNTLDTLDVARNICKRIIRNSTQ